jgi:hypothetical protein
MHLINKLIIEVLGWDMADCNCEDTHEGNYADSLLSGYKLNSFSWLAGQGKLFSELIC